MPLSKKKRPYSETQIYRDASVYLQRLTEIVRNMPRYIQFSIGEEALKDAVRVVQLMKLSYEASEKAKLVYIEETAEKMAGLEVTVNQLFECKFINLKAKAYLYIMIGSMQKQLKAWREKIKNRADSAGYDNDGCGESRP